MQVIPFLEPGSVHLKLAASIIMLHIFYILVSPKCKRDVRASKYKENDNSWSPSNKQKRKTVTVPEEDIERTSNRQKSFGRGCQRQHRDNR
ncbi:unnamed protein product [Cylicocyclus nassatus]|uniref:Uncharacterized protein n=1 Tax=Cylicocyclus nassatus TaxID=53992 RepID=A0AA36GZU5_CYLNA|nr:unnamed protein product [Cylicocyclus nassatus]